MNIGLISGSPKMENSVSEYLLDNFKLYLTSEKLYKFKICKPEIDDKDLEKIKEMDALVVFCPLYVDLIPSHLLKVLSIIQKDGIEKNINIYAVVQCGFPEGEQCRYALEIIRNWSIKCRFSWKEGLGIGGSGMIAEQRKLGKNLSAIFKNFSNDIINENGKKNMFVSPKIPKFIYELMADISFIRKARANGLKIKDISKQ